MAFLLLVSCANANEATSPPPTDDPAFLTTEHWNGLANLLYSWWFYILTIVAFGLTFLLAHAIIPSLVTTKDIRADAQRIRPLLYIGALLFLGLAGFFLASIVDLARVIETFYSRWLI